MAQKQLTIGLVCSTAETVDKNPNGYKGAERVIALLGKHYTQNQKGHKVILFAADGSESYGEFVSLGRRLWSYQYTKKDVEEANERTLEVLYNYRNSLDIIHSHTDITLYAKDLFGIPSINTIHGDVPPDGMPVVNGRNIVFISNAQKEAFLDRFQNVPEIQNAPVVYNGLDIQDFTPSYEPGKHLMFLGRISPDKGMHIAIDVATALRTTLVSFHRLPTSGVDDIFANKDRHYHEMEILPRLRNNTFVESYEDPQPTEARDTFLRDSIALIAPSGYPYSKADWTEPFGLNVLEALASGTPAIVYNKGGPVEIVQDGISGYVCKNPAQMVDAVRDVMRRGKAMRYSARRRAFAFSAEKMAEKYLQHMHLLLRGDDPKNIESILGMSEKA